MISPSDPTYQASKFIKRGDARIDDDFKPLAEWIDKSFGVNTVNIIYGTTRDGRSSLEIVLEYKREEITFHHQDRKKFGYDPEKQAAIAEQFRRIAANWKLRRLFSQARYETENLWVFYSAFEPVARHDANMSIPLERIESLKSEINDESLWMIKRFGDSTTFFLYTDAQVQEATNDGRQKDWLNRYQALLKQYDEFDYFKYYYVHLESKETLDNKWAGSLALYYK